MNFTYLKEGTPYIVTKESDDGSFQVGDQITRMVDGSISNLQAEGWLEPDALAEATVGMECEVGRAKIQRRKEALLRRLAKLEAEND